MELDDIVPLVPPTAQEKTKPTGIARIQHILSIFWLVISIIVFGYDTLALILNYNCNSMLINLASSLEASEKSNYFNLWQALFGLFICELIKTISDLSDIFVKNKTYVFQIAMRMLDVIVWIVILAIYVWFTTIYYRCKRTPDVVGQVKSQCIYLWAGSIVHMVIFFIIVFLLIIFIFLGILFCIILRSKTRHAEKISIQES